MIIFLSIFVVILLIGCRATSIKEFNTDYMSKDNTNIIKGVFVVFVFFSHCSQYLKLGGVYDAPYLVIRDFLGQMIVAMFLFYSGYGIMESIKNKSFAYVKTIPVRRVFKTLINFDIIVLLFLIINIVFQSHYKLSQILLSFVAWENIGNSNWYILAILILYLLAFFAFLPVKFSNKKNMHIICAAILTLLALLASFIIFIVGKESWYYNTFLIFPLGVWFSILKPYIDRFVMRNHLIYFIILTIGLFALIFTHMHVDDSPYISNGYYRFSLPYIIWSFVFTLFIVLVTMKIRIKSFVFTWLGEHIFSIYMLQRVPMTIFKYIGFTDDYKYLFIIFSIIISVLLAIVFDFMIKKMWAIIKI